MVRENLLLFTQYTKPDYRENWHHKVLAEKLDHVAIRGCRRLMVFMPPQHGKSELVSRRFPAFILGRDPELRLIAASHTYDLAVRMNRDVQRIMTSDPYRRVFADARLDDRRVRSSSQVQARRTMDFFEIPGHGGGLRSAGVGNSIAGNPADGAIIDDPIGKREDDDSAAMRQRVWEWYTNDLYTRLSAEAWIVLTHTRWHRDDLAGRLLRKMADRSADQWEILCLPAVLEDGAAADLCDERQPGGKAWPEKVLWPAFKSAADLDIIRLQDAKTYAALYQQNPADASTAEWPPTCFGNAIWCPAEKWPTDFRLRVVCVDASKGRSDKQGDYCAIVFLGAGKDGLFYVDAVLERIPLDQIVRKVIVFCDEKKPDFVGIEAEQFQELLVHEFRRQCGQNFSLRWPIYRMMTKGIAKVSRIRRLSEYINNREFRFRADSPGCRLLVDQLMDFPLADHDDGPDALEMCTRLPLEAVK
jgi:predicted phage terminase large subunit-like protein